MSKKKQFLYILLIILSSTHITTLPRISQLTRCFTGLPLSRELGKKIATLQKPFFDLAKKKELKTINLPGSNRFHISLRTAKATEKKCIIAKEALENQLDTLSPISFTLSKNNPISFFKVSGTKNQYHVVIEVELTPNNIVSKIDQIYHGILPKRPSPFFVSHITLGEVTTDNAEKVKKAITEHLLKSKHFENPTEIVIDEIKFNIGKKSKDKGHMFKLPRLQSRKNSPAPSTPMMYSLP